MNVLVVGAGTPSPTQWSGKARLSLAHGKEDQVGLNHTLKRLY